MDPTHVNDEESLYHATAAKPAAERAAYLRQACKGDSDLLARVTALLQSRDECGDFLENLPLGQKVMLDDSFVVEGPGTTIDRYKLLEKIGEGGMAVVYMAEQQRPIRRKVALKIIKLGMDTRQVIARFEAERQALAMMDHPCIAKVLDAGATETGRPYFVMELVEGVSITEYCDRNRLSTKDRLGLFLQVCNAVQHAHQKGIIHRDIKPSNVMATHHDGKSVPKVIDFGIAKATNQKLTEKTLFTRYAHLIGTPAYMSPEQAELSDLDIDTRSDIYSLGVLLYELLTGTTPFSEEELRRAGYIEMQRVIREQEPLKPSTKLTTLGDLSTEIAKRRNSSPDLLRKIIRGDLDWIVMKTLEKDRSQRYETTSGLAEDLRRHLGHEPVLAHGPSTTYRLGKFLHRHHSQILAVSAMLVVTVALATLLFQWDRNRRKMDETEVLRHAAILSQAREQHARGDRQAAVEAVQPILASRHAGPDARLFYAALLVDDRRFEEAQTLLRTLLQERREIAGAAHSLLARLLWESESLDSEKLKRIEEHRRQAEALLPETAEAYFLRGMTAVTIKEQLAFLDKSLQLASRDPDPLNPITYESHRLRAFIYYASRKYEKMKDDGLAMTILRPSDPLGYSLRAVALCELGQYQAAIAAYDSALALVLKDDPLYFDLTVRRVETLLRMRSYQPVIAAAQEALRLWPDRPIFQYNLFAAQTALGDYDAAAAVFARITSPGPEARRPFEDWCTKYIFDGLQAGRLWHPSDRAPVGAAFLPLVEAEETYQHLAAKAKRVIANSHTTRWSPDGKKLVFSPGAPGNSGVAVFDPATNETELLIVPGKEPIWSPDGKYIAFVRDCQALRVPEFAAAEGKPKRRRRVEEEVWVMKADGNEPRRLVQGGWPSWSQDSQRVYYHSHLDNALCSISLEGPDATAKRIMACSYPWPSVSPDGQRMAYLEAGLLKVKDLTTQTTVAQWTVPALPWIAPAWSPTGRELYMGTSAGIENKTGLCVCRFDENEPLLVLDGQVTSVSWAQDATKLVFHLGAPYFEVWTADLDPKVSVIETLGPARTMDEHFRDMAALHTRRIAADPLDAYAYFGRARYCDYLHDRVRANADMRRWSAAASGRLPWDCRCVVNLPLDCELVFSAERPVNTFSTMSIAFGQKGRCEMKLFEMPMIAASLLGLCLLPGIDTQPARADFVFGQPSNLGSPINTSGDDWGPCISPDGLELYFARGAANGDLWMARRTNPYGEWGIPADLGPLVNDPLDDWGPSIPADGLSLYFASNRTGGSGGHDVWMATRTTANDDWVAPNNLGATVNSGATDWQPCISSDGLELYFTSNRPGGYGTLDLWVTTRASVHDDWGAPVNLGPMINTPAQECWAGISPDGLVLFFASTKPGGFGTLDMYMARRATRKDPWGTPVNLGPGINDITWQSGSKVSSDGSMLYFMCGRPGLGGIDIWQAPILPVVDFNGDGAVDATDMDLLVADWGKADSLCDIAPFAWGDGVVDEEDLAVLMESLMTPGPKAADVPCDIVLSWVSPSFADSHGVYLGTSFDAVNNATREDPCGVLVSEGQVETTYAPEGLLEFERTYYWRVDIVEVVVGSLEPVIYKGPVLSFTTAAFAYPIQNIVGTASSAQPSMGPEKTVDGSGLDTGDGHSTAGSDMWLSTDAGPHWIQYEFDQVYTLHELWVWNYNSQFEPILGFGLKDVTVEYSIDGATWTPLDAVPEFAKASGQPGYIHNTTVSFGGVAAKYVKLTIEASWGDVSPSTGLSEVRFFYIPDSSVTQP